ncbi:hypothetical protein QZH63_05570, partial [Eikenella corrodens]|nr:hypothetical protein [Eikenella corrodens]
VTLITQAITLPTSIKLFLLGVSDWFRNPYTARPQSLTFRHLFFVIKIHYIVRVSLAKHIILCCLLKIRMGK